MSIEAISYDDRLEKLNELDSLKPRYETAVARQRAWKRARVGVLLAPLVTAAVLVSPPVRGELNIWQKFFAETFSLEAMLGGFVTADRRRQKAFIRGNQIALSAVPTIEELRIPTPNWVNEGLQPDDDINPAIISS